MPLDGEVASELNGIETISERKAPAFDIGIGVAYSWRDVCALSADISTQQGGDVEGSAFVPLHVFACCEIILPAHGASRNLRPYLSVNSLARSAPS